MDDIKRCFFLIMLGLSEKENQYLQLMLIHVPYELILESEMTEFRLRIKKEAGCFNPASHI